LKVIKAIIIIIMPDLSSVVPAPRFTATMGHYLMEIGNPGENFFKNHPAKILPGEHTGKPLPWDS